MLTRRAALLTSGAFGAIAISGCAAVPAPTSIAPTASPAADQSAALNAYLEEVFERRILRNPQLATSLGDKRGYDRLNDVSDGRDAEDFAALQSDVAQMQARFGTAPLDAQAKLSFRLFEAELARAQASRPFQKHRYVFNQMYGVQTGVPTFLINNHRVDNLADAQAYVARLNAMGAQLDQYRQNSEISAQAGILAPKFVYGYCTPAAKAIIAGAPFGPGPDSPLWADFKAKLAKLDADPAQKAALMQAAEAALRDTIAPAYARILATISTHEAKAGSDDGVWRLPDGEAFYAERLAAQTTTSLSAAEIHQLGLDNVARLQDEMRAILRRVAFQGDLDAFFKFVETDKQFFLPQTSEGKARYIALATEAINAMKQQLPKAFRRLPKADLEVRAVEAFRENSAGLAFYQRPAADGSRPGYYYANTVDMAALPLYQLEALAYHEGIPGHHMQIAITQELEGLPRLRRFGGYTVYSEGWGLYAEKLGKELGGYRDAYSEFGRLTLELRRAIRLVVDTGLHSKRWPREQAVQYILANQPGDRAQAVKDIDRYIVLPGQATAYLIGSLHIQKQRAWAQNALGPKFDVRDFHEAVLANGFVPLDVLDELIAAYIART